MEIKENVIENKIKDCFQQYISSIKKDKYTVVISHCGVFSQDLIHSLLIKNEELMKPAGDNKILIKRVFSILIEGLQNICFHGGKDCLENQLSYLVISKNSGYYKLNFANLIDAENTDSLSNQVEKLNHMNVDEVKALHTKVLTEDGFSKKGGAGLGFITMRMKSQNQVNYSTIELDEQLSLFSLEVIFDREA